MMQHFHATRKQLHSHTHTRERWQHQEPQIPLTNPTPSQKKKEKKRGREGKMEFNKIMEKRIKLKQFGRKPKHMVTVVVLKLWAKNQRCTLNIVSVCDAWNKIIHNSIPILTLWRKVHKYSIWHHRCWLDFCTVM